MALMRRGALFAGALFAGLLFGPAAEEAQAGTGWKPTYAEMWAEAYRQAQAQLVAQAPQIQPEQQQIPEPLRQAYSARLPTYQPSTEAVEMAFRVAMQGLAPELAEQIEQAIAEEEAIIQILLELM